MLRKTILALATTAVVAGATMGGAQAHGFKVGFGHGHHTHFSGKGFGYSHCKIIKKKVFVGYSKVGHPIFRFKRVKVCF
ncbi:hypothetical protein [Jiella mangrovi]|uniref:Sulfur globule protein n=1 Tax=Jiella mangrovi TaxID=2821407 RepID=A0ABS4BGC8_9HYPH|nr:hypothetical protein [Jiella mangrovi]MBP0615592.1 hypothetical protein [Jiella mangrovi]